MKFRKSDFKDMAYPVLSIPEGKTVLKHFPGLRKFPEFQKRFDPYTDKIHRYVLLMYTVNILQSLPNVEERKIEAAKLAGFELNKGKFDEKTEKLLSCEVSEINDLIIRVCCLDRNEDFAELMVYEQSYYAQLKKLLKPEGAKIKDIRDNAKQFKKDIKELRKILLNQDESPGLIDRLYDYIDGIDLGISPEEIALAKKNNSLKELIHHPYE